MGILSLLWATLGGLVVLVADWFRYRFFRWYAIVAGVSTLFFLLQLVILLLSLPQWLGVGVTMLSFAIALLALGIFLIIPSVVWRPFRSIWMSILLVQIGICLAQLVRYQLDLSPMVVLTALLLGVFSYLIGSGSYRPYEVRAMRRRLSTLTMMAAFLFILWHPVIVPAVGWGKEVVASSPVANFYQVLELRTRRVLLGEEAKTSSLTELKDELQRVHKERWRKGINQIPSIPLAPSEWRELGVEDP